MDRPGGLDKLDGQDELDEQVNLHGLEEPDRPDGLEELTDQTGSTSWADLTSWTSWTARRSCLKEGAGWTGRTRQAGQASNKSVAGHLTFHLGQSRDERTGRTSWTDRKDLISWTD